MQVKELFERSAKAGYLDLQALIMFLVFEKDVLAMEDSAEKLKVYYQDKHSERMNEELNAYKSKMNMKYDPALYGFNHGGGSTYILAKSVEQAKFIANDNGIISSDYEVLGNEELMNYDGLDMPVSNLVNNQSIGVLGGYGHR